jgi:hypothetical protein
MFDARNSASGEYEYLIEVERTRDAEDEYRYMANVAQIVGRTTGDRITHHPQLHRHYGLTPEEAIEKAFDEAESVRKPLSRFARVIQAARLLFDSQLAPTPAGLRAVKPGSRMLVYASDDYLIDVQLQSGNTRGDTLMLGQITSAQTPNPRVEGSRVVLERDTQEIARGVTNELGEFELEFGGPATDLSLTFVLAQCQVVVRLGNLTRNP